MKRIILDVPYYSQYLDIEDKEWQTRSCGIVSLKMVLDYFSVKEMIKTPSCNELLKEGVFINGNMPAYGWVHESIVLLARNHSLPAFRQEFRSIKINLKDGKEEKSEYENKLSEYGIDKIMTSIMSGCPVIVSVYKRFKEKGKFHIVPLIGLEFDDDRLKGFYYHEPESFSREDGANKFVSLETFKENWRKMAIFTSV